MELSILIPSRCEMFLVDTIQDIIKHSEADTEIIACLDGQWADPPVPQHDRVNVIYIPESVGQRAAANLACKLAQGKYVMKLDAHCSFDKGFDRKILDGFQEVGDDVTMVPIMRNLWAFDWKCYHCGWKKYQGPTPDKCEQCGKTDKIRRKMMWVGKHNPQSWSYCFDAEPHFQYFEDYKHRPGIKEGRDKTGFTETMSLQGSCFIATKDKYLELNLCGETLGSWGNQGLEVACRTWLSGGRVLVNHRTWYAHMFRTQGGDFSFPYHQSGRDVDRTKKKTWELFSSGKWDKQVHPVSWLVEKFWPVKGWTQEDLDKLKESELKPTISALKIEVVSPPLELQAPAPAPSSLEKGMDDKEFELLLNQRLCGLADTILYYYNPCRIENGECIEGKMWCCSGTRFKTDVPYNQIGRPDCKFLGCEGCSFPNTKCKVWLCDHARKGDERCGESLELIDRIAKIHKLT